MVDEILTGSSAIRQSKTRKYIDSIIARYEFYQRRGRMWRMLVCSFAPAFANFVRLRN